MTALTIAPEIQRPTDLFRCVHLSCVLQAQRCVERQNAPNQSRSPYAKAKGDSRFPRCTSGKCAQGKAVALAIAGQETQGARPVNWQAQHAAKKRDETPAAPAKELHVAEAVEETKKCVLCGDRLRSDNSTGWCRDHLASSGRLTLPAYRVAQNTGVEVPEAMRPRRVGRPPGPAKVAQLAPVQKLTPNAQRIRDAADGIQPDSVEDVLRSRLAHHEAQANRLRRALAVLAEAP